MRTYNEILVQKYQFLFGRHYLWWKSQRWRSHSCNTMPISIHLRKSGINQVWKTEGMLNHMIRKKQSEEELGGTSLVWSRNEEHTGTPMQAARDEELFSLPTACWKSRNQGSLACWRIWRVPEQLGLEKECWGCLFWWPNSSWVCLTWPQNGEKSLATQRFLQFSLSIIL